MPLNMDDLHSSVGKQTAYKRACRQIFKPCHICPRIRSPYGSSSEETTGRLRNPVRNTEASSGGLQRCWKQGECLDVRGR
jgi:hypothetical protein